VTSELRVGGSIDLAHAAGSDLLYDLVVGGRVWPITELGSSTSERD